MAVAGLDFPPSAPVCVPWSATPPPAWARPVGREPASRADARSSVPKESPPCLRSASPLSRAPSSARAPPAARGARDGFPPSSTGTARTPGTSPCPATAMMALKTRERAHPHRRPARRQPACPAQGGPAPPDQGVGRAHRPDHGPPGREGHRRRAGPGDRGGVLRRPARPAAGAGRREAEATNIPARSRSTSRAWRSALRSTPASSPCPPGSPWWSTPRRWSLHVLAAPTAEQLEADLGEVPAAEEVPPSPEEAAAEVPAAPEAEARRAPSRQEAAEASDGRDRLGRRRRSG